MLTSGLVFMVLVLLILLMRERLDQRRSVMMVDGLQLAHDIRSPLSVLKSLFKDGQNLKNKEELIFKLIDRMERMTFFNGEKNAEHFKKDEFHAVSLEKILRDTLEEKKIEFKNLLIEVKGSVNLKNVFSKEYQLKRILSNIINNAVEAMSSQRELKITSKQINENKCEISITDYGMGINEKDLTKIFEKGFTTKKEGKGLGLFHAKTEIESWGGELIVESSEGEGTTIKIRLLTKLPEMVLLEDEEIIREGWEYMAKKSNVFLKTYACSKDLFAQKLIFDKKIKLYLDHELNEKLKGLDIAKKLFKRGLRDIHLCTGHKPEHFKNHRFVNR